MSRDQLMGHIWMQIDDWRLYYSRFASFHCINKDVRPFLSFFCLPSSRMILQQTICHCRSYSTVVRVSPRGCIMWSSFRILFFSFLFFHNTSFWIKLEPSSLVGSQSSFRHRSSSLPQLSNTTWLATLKTMYPANVSVKGIPNLRLSTDRDFIAGKLVKARRMIHRQPTTQKPQGVIKINRQPSKAKASLAPVMSKILVVGLDWLIP